MKRTKIIAIGAGLVTTLVLGCASVAFAQQSSSTNYGVDEVYFGTGGELEACSSGPVGYCSKQAAGETAVGNPSSTTYQTRAGHNTDRTPSLEFVVTNPNADLGVLSVGGASTTSATFSVKTYLASGYIVQSQSDPPASTGPGAHTFTNLTSPTASSPGTEQFGINLVANTSPSVGANPSQDPDGTFSFGTAATGYNTANQFKYVKGDTIASSNSSSGKTNYTISYLYNISNVTPAGTYTFNHILVATSTF